MLAQQRELIHVNNPLNWAWYFNNFHIKNLKANVQHYGLVINLFDQSLLMAQSSLLARNVAKITIVRVAWTEALCQSLTRFSTNVMSDLWVVYSPDYSRNDSNWPNRPFHTALSNFEMCNLQLSTLSTPEKFLSGCQNIEHGGMKFVVSLPFFNILLRL